MDAPVRKKARARRETVVNLRMTKAMRDVVDDAAMAVGKTRTDFIIESTHQRATDILLDRRLFALDEAQYDAFVRSLDARPAPNAKLKALLAAKAPWEK
jgi:uncharacterized protein (DUF1778 family)